MTAILHALEQRRLIDSNGIADASSIYFYTSGTLTPAPVYTDAALTTEHPSPIVVESGAAVPDIYLDSTLTYRRRIVYPTGAVDDSDPYQGGQVRAGDLASTEAGKGAALVALEGGGNVQEAIDRVDGFSLVLQADKTGATDAAAAIEAAVLTINAAGGGTLYIPAGTYLLSTLSSAAVEPSSIHLDPNTPFAYVKARNNVRIIGAGKGVTTLLVASGANSGPHPRPEIFGTADRALLENFHLEGFTVDWNNPNNNLAEVGYLARQNATLLTRRGASNCSVVNVETLDAPGTNSIFIQNGFAADPATERGGNILISHCDFINSGSAAPGNYSPDTSDIYIAGDDVQVLHCRGLADSRMQGALYEVHGARWTCVGNRTKNYDLACWIVEDIASQPGNLVSIRDEHHEDLWFAAFSVDGQVASKRIGRVKVRDSLYTIASGATFPTSIPASSTPHPFINSSAGQCEGLDIQGCRFTGNNDANLGALRIDGARELVFKGNVVKNFLSVSSSAGFPHGFGIYASATGLLGDTGRYADRVIITDNDFIDVTRPVHINTQDKTIGEIDISGNRLRITAAGAATLTTAALTPNPFYTNLLAPAESGFLGNNQVTGYTTDNIYLYNGNRIPTNQIRLETPVTVPAIGTGVTRSAVTTIPVFGWKKGDHVIAAHAQPVPGVRLEAQCHTNESIDVWWFNETAGATAAGTAGTLTLRCVDPKALGR